MMKLFWAALAAMLLCALPVHAQVGAQSPVNAGRFVWGDELTDLRITIKQPTGTAYDVTGASVYLICKNVITRKTFTITGDIVSATSGIVKFEDIGTSLQNPSARMRDTYDCRVRLALDGEIGYSALFRLSVEVWP